MGYEKHLVHEAHSPGILRVMSEKAARTNVERLPTTEERNDLQVALAPKYLNLPASLAMREWFGDGGPLSYAALFEEYEQDQKQKGTPISYNVSADNLEAIKKGMEEFRISKSGPIAEAA